MDQRTEVGGCATLCATEGDQYTKLGAESTWNAFATWPLNMVVVYLRCPSVWENTTPCILDVSGKGIFLANDR